LPRKPAHLTVNRDHILQAAAVVFQERGYQGATMADIARRVRLTAGSLYHHFPNGKRDLLVAVLNSGLDVVLDQFAQIRAANMPPTQTLIAMIDAHIVNVSKHVSVGAAMVFEIRALIVLEDDPNARASFLERRDRFEQNYREVIEAGIACGEFRPVDVHIFTKTLLGAHNWISVWYREGGRLDGVQIAARMADTFISALRCQPHLGANTPSEFVNQ
jgi:TetR/AcrR family transcriptional regulator, cholesterol catabolism regulator